MGPSPVTKARASEFHGPAGDIACTLVTLAGDERARGRPWHVPTDRPASLREVPARSAGVPDPGVQVLPRVAVRLGGPAAQRELPEVRHQFAAPFVADSSAAQDTFGLTPTPFGDGIAATVAWWRANVRAAACVPGRHGYR